MPQTNEVQKELVEKAAEQIDKLKSYFDHAVVNFNDFLELVYTNKYDGNEESDSKLKKFLHSSLDDSQTSEQQNTDLQEFKDYLRDRDVDRLDVRHDSDVYQKKGLEILTSILMGMI